MRTKKGEENFEIMEIYQTIIANGICQIFLNMSPTGRSVMVFRPVGAGGSMGGIILDKTIIITGAIHVIQG